MHYILLLYFLFQHTVGQNNQNGCAQYLRNIHRMGPNVQGKLEIPTDEHYPKYKLRIAFSSPIHHMTIRQSLAKDTGTHREFVIDPMEMRRDGKLALDVFIRLHRAFGQMSRMTRIVYNNKVLCGDPLDTWEIDESFTSDAPTTTKTPLYFRLPTNSTTQSSKIKDFFEEEEEDIFGRSFS